MFIAILLDEDETVLSPKSVSKRSPSNLPLEKGAIIQMAPLFLFVKVAASCVDSS